MTGTAFLLAMMATPDTTLHKALSDPTQIAALAKKYGQKIEWVEFDIRTWLGRAR